MSKSNEFKFIVKAPLLNSSSNGHEQRCAIVAQYHSVYYSIEINPNSNLSTEDQIRLAIAELKVRLIQDISTAEFEVEKE